MQVKKNDGGEDFAARLSERMSEKGFTQASLARLLNIGQSTVSRWLVGTKPQPRMIGALAAALAVRMDWLASGIGPKSGSDEHLARLSASRDLAMSEHGDAGVGQTLAEEAIASKAPIFFVPVISWTHAGQAVSYEELPEHMRDTVPTLCRDARAFALQVEGDSMEPRVLNGDCVVIMPGEEPRNGCLVVAKLRSDGVMLRRFTAVGRDTIRLTAYNPIYPTTDHSRSEFHWIYPVHSTVRREWS